VLVSDHLYSTVYYRLGIITSQTLVEISTIRKCTETLIAIFITFSVGYIYKLLDLIEHYPNKIDKKKLSAGFLHGFKVGYESPRDPRKCTETLIAIFITFSVGYICARLK
jgi:hypothetical protein